MEEERKQRPLRLPPEQREKLEWLKTVLHYNSGNDLVLALIDAEARRQQILLGQRVEESSSDAYVVETKVNDDARILDLYHALPPKAQPGLVEFLFGLVAQMRDSQGRGNGGLRR